jgi:hypothetical protein
MLRDLAEELDTGDFDMDLTGFDANGLEELMTAAPPDDASATIHSAHEVIVECKDEPEQQRIYEQLITEGKQCRLSTF